MTDNERIDDLDTLHTDDDINWRTRGRSSKGTESKLDTPTTNYSGYYTKEELLSLYSPYIRPPTGFPSYEKVTSKTPLLPMALAPIRVEESEEDAFSRSRGSGRGRGRGRGAGTFKSEYGWGKEGALASPVRGGRGKELPPWKRGEEEGFFDSANYDEERKLTEYEFGDKKFNSLLDEAIEGDARCPIKRDIHSLLDEPIELEERPRAKKPDIKSMLDAAKKAKSASLQGGVHEDLDIPSDIPQHHFELEDSQAFFDMGPKRSKQPAPQPQVQAQVQNQQGLSQPHPQHVSQHTQGPSGFFGMNAVVPQQSRNWFYRDPKGNEQGPFSSAQMEKWLKAKYFTIDLDVRAQDDVQFLPLALHFIQEHRNPFSEVPLQQWLSVPTLTEFQLAFLQYFTRFQCEQQRQNQQLQQMMQQAVDPTAASVGPIFGPVKTGAPPNSSLHSSLFGANPSSPAVVAAGPILGPTVHATSSGSNLANSLFGGAPEVASTGSSSGPTLGPSVAVESLFGMGGQAQAPASVPEPVTAGPILGPSTNAASTASTTVKPEGGSESGFNWNALWSAQEPMKEATEKSNEREEIKNEKKNEKQQKQEKETVQKAKQEAAKQQQKQAAPKPAEKQPQPKQTPPAKKQEKAKKEKKTPLDEEQLAKDGWSTPKAQTKKSATGQPQPETKPQAPPAGSDPLKSLWDLSFGGVEEEPEVNSPTLSSLLAATNRGNPWGLSASSPAAVPAKPTTPTASPLSAIQQEQAAKAREAELLRQKQDIEFRKKQREQEEKAKNPWSAASGSKPKTLAEIQREEELQAKAIQEQKKQQTLMRQQQVQQTPLAGPWGGFSSPSSVVGVLKGTGKMLTLAEIQEQERAALRQKKQSASSSGPSLADIQQEQAKRQQQQQQQQQQQRAQAQRPQQQQQPQPTKPSKADEDRGFFDYGDDDDSKNFPSLGGSKTPAKQTPPVQQKQQAKPQQAKPQQPQQQQQQQQAQPTNVANWAREEAKKLFGPAYGTSFLWSILPFLPTYKSCRSSSSISSTPKEFSKDNPSLH
eukprot:TRINITY_DN3290_c0_g1_i1.p1 TRINITY_DN3290_c0_g1~~TRINITY_DN3290_c0_g1_i1.p1  ORF type:complete len:1054 (-),score=323.90 TRINITY_DN3290_c0_g1_i1:230-3337(-)